MTVTIAPAVHPADNFDLQFGDILGNLLIIGFLPCTRAHRWRDAVDRILFRGNESLFPSNPTFSMVRREDRIFDLIPLCLCNNKPVLINYVIRPLSCYVIRPIMSLDHSVVIPTNN